jgi:peptidyl-prolyl cis-trans isomerase SurA
MKLKKIILLATTLFLLSTQSHAQQEVELNSVAAVVNDQPITQQQLDHEVNFYRHQMQDSKMQTPPDNILEAQVLNQMIVTQLQLQLAKEMKITVTSDQVAAQLTTLAKQQNISLDQLFTKAEESGLTKAELRQQITDQLTIHELVNKEVVPKISITDQEVAMYQNNQASLANQNTTYDVKNILIALPSSPTSEQVSKAKQKAQNLIDQITGGEVSFDQAAISSSDDQFALKGGDLGSRKAVELPAVFVDDVVSMQVGDVAGPIKADNGFHIIMLASKDESDDQGTMSDEQVRQALFNRKLFESIQTWIDGLRAQAFVDIVNGAELPSGQM